MSVFEIEGVARREVACDIANIEITFRMFGTNSYDVSQRVMDQCDEFLETISKSGINPEVVRYGDDRIDEAGYDEYEKVHAQRNIHIRTAFDMKIINYLQSVLQKGKYDYKFDVDCELSDPAGIRMELAKEALRNSKAEAEQLAEVLGLTIKGVESIRKNKWDDRVEIVECCGESEGCLVLESVRPSDSLGASTRIESVTLYVEWILE